MAGNEVAWSLDRFGEASRDAGRLEALYRQAAQDGKANLFAEAVSEAYRQRPAELLLAAWHHRLAQPITPAPTWSASWRWAVPLSLVNGLLFWWMAATLDHLADSAQFLAVTATATIPAVLIMLYLTIAGARPWQRLAVPAVALTTIALFAHSIAPGFERRDLREQYYALAIISLLYLSWSAVGAYLSWQGSYRTIRFAYLVKSLEAMIVMTLLGAALAVFAGITRGLFSALEIDLPTLVWEACGFGGAGVILVLAWAIVYDPALAPADQQFDRGLSTFVPTLMRILLLPTSAVLLVYTSMIPFNFWAAFDNRDVLIIYNAMQLAVIILLAGAAPADDRELSPALATWLRRGIVAVALLTLLVSLYAASALAYRTAIGEWTPNRIACLGWNTIAIGILASLLVKQARANVRTWLPDLKATLTNGVAAAVAWALFVIMGLPWFFGAARYVATAIG